MSIQYTYTVDLVDAQSRVMEVVFQSPGRPDVRVGARIPAVGEDLEEVIRQYAPLSYWGELQQELQEVPVGFVGVYTPPPEEPLTLEIVKERKIREIADWRYRREVSGISLNGVQIATDRESQAKISSAYMSLAQGLVSSIQWKTADTNWITLDLPMMQAVAQAVLFHVQQSFDLEKLYVDQVKAVQPSDTAIDEVLAIQPAPVFQV